MAKKKKKKSSSSKKLKKQQKQATKRKEKRRRLAQIRDRLLHPSLNQAAAWPLHEVLISESWRDPAELTQILVVRRGPADMYAVGVVLVDQACLGVKSAFGRIVDALEYRKIRSQLLETQDFVEGNLDCAVKIIEEAIDYARSFGIKPDPDVKQALILMRAGDPDACQEDVPLGGPDGKPFFVAGPYDNVPKILKTLIKHLGPDGFTYLLPLPFDADEMLEWDDETGEPIFEEGVWLDEDVWPEDEM